MLNKIRTASIKKFLSGFMLISALLSFSGINFLFNWQRHKEKTTVKKPKLVTSSNRGKNINSSNNIEPNIEQKINIGVEAQNIQTTANEILTDTNQTTRRTTTVNETPKPRYNQDINEYLLARVIHAEARGETFEGQVAVGAVLLNRLRDSRFPNTLEQIVFKKGEFCTVRDGQIWKKPSQQSVRAAKLALSGWDPTSGALYFYNPAKTTSRWIWSRPIVNKIGNHIFAI